MYFLPTGTAVIDMAAAAGLALVKPGHRRSMARDDLTELAS